jgi:calcium-activated chloride channel regulator 4
MTADITANLLSAVDRLKVDCPSNSSIAVGISGALDALAAETSTTFHYNNNTSGAGVVLLLSSRKDHIEAAGDPKLQEDELVRRGVRVVSVLLGSATDTLLVDLADQTDGRSYYVPDDSSPGDMILPFQQALAAFRPSVVSSNQTVVLSRWTARGVAAGTSLVTNVTMDETMGRNLVIQLDFTETKQASLSLTFLNETVTVNGSSGGLFYHRVPLIPPGVHSLAIRPSTNLTFLSLTVTSQPTVGRIPVTADCWTSASGSRVDLTAGARLAVYARVRRGRQPVLGATVVARLVSDHEDLPQELVLLDNGAGADSMQDDGIYSRYIYALSL